MIDLQPNLELTVEQAERLVQSWLDVPVACSGIRRLEGGLVNTVLQIDFDRPPYRAVAKLHGRQGDTFSPEARALEYLRTETECPVPGVYLHDQSGRVVPHAVLLLEHIPGVCLNGLDLEPPERADIEAQLAAVLGELHRHKGGRWGDLDAGRGSVTWAEVFTARLEDARDHPLIAKRMGSEVCARIDTAIDVAQVALRDSGRPTLVHGDVWDGNVIVRRENGRWRLAGLLDPNLQFADVELELAYLEVFDTPRNAFFAAYANYHAPRPGYELRRLFYWLHTALVHVALFGGDFFRDYTARTVDSIDQLVN